MLTHISGQARNCVAKVGAGSTGLVDTLWNPFTVPTTAVYALATGNTHLYVGDSYLGVPGQFLLSFARVSTTGAGIPDTNWSSIANSQARGAVLAIALSESLFLVVFICQLRSTREPFLWFASKAVLQVLGQ